MPTVAVRWWERSLAAKSGRQILFAFWVAFFAAGFCSAMPAPQSTLLGGVTQLVLAMIWLGYPIALVRCFFNDKRGRTSSYVLLGAIALGYWLSVVTYSDSGGTVRGVVAPVVGAVLIFAPFVGGAYALTNAEGRAKVKPASGVVLTTLALFALPFFGAYVHERFRRVYALLNTGE